METLEQRTLLSDAPLSDLFVVSVWGGPTSRGPQPRARSSADTLQPTEMRIAATNAAGLPLLHSLPGAPATIFLDFDGDSASNTTAYSEDADGTTFNAAEQASITECWRQMSIYYSMFDVDVTTEQPNVSTTKTAWDAIGNNISGGYSYVGVFPNTIARSWNNSGDARSRVSGIAHEIGHNFGNSHTAEFDALGNLSREYAVKFDDLHGPLMGVDYDGVVHKWTWWHPSSDPSVLQDDMAKIASKIKSNAPAGYTGDGYRSDDHGNTSATATAMTSSGPAFVASGIIERLADVDYFSFVSSGAAYMIHVTPVAPSGLDAKLSLFSSSGVLLAAADSSINSQEFALNLPAGTYYIAVASHGNYGDQGSYDVGARQLPAGWDTAHIGSVTAYPGNAQYSVVGDTWTIAGSGSDIWNTADGLRFTYQMLTGDGSITARVTSLTNTDGWAKVGVMIRESLAANSRQMAMLTTPSNGLQAAWRTSTGGSTSGYWSTASAFSPVWVRLTRIGNTIQAYRSTDGSSWSTWGSAQTFSGLPTNVYIGLAVTAHNNSALNTTTFDNVSLTGTIGAPATYNSLSAPANLTVSPGTGSGLNLSWNAVTDAIGYTIERSSDGVHYALIGSTTGTTTYSDNSLPGSLRYFYRVSAKDASGNSIPSDSASAINRPSAPSAPRSDLPSFISVSTTKVVIDWKDVDGETGYRVERSSDGGNTWVTRAANLAANTPSYTDSTVTAGTNYTYRITPLSSLGDGIAYTVTGASRLAAVTNIGFDVIQSNQIVFHWTDIAGETAYRIDRSTDNSSWTTLTNSLPAGTTTYTDSTVSAFTEYYYRILGTNTYTQSVYNAPLFTATPATTTLPSPWISQDIGAISAGAGATRYNAGTFDVISSGSDIWGSADAFRYTYQILKGDGQITARVAAQENTGGWSKVGVMIRESLTANSRHAMVVVTPENGIAMQYRTSTGGSSTHIAGTTGVKAPYWVRLVRAGSVLTGYCSADGTTWTQVGQVTISMANQVYIGLSADSNTTTTLNASKFDNVTVSNNAPTVTTAATATPSTVVGTATSLSVLGDDDHGESNLAYTWAVSAKPAGAPDPVFAVNGTNAAKATGATFSAAGAYTFTVTITDSGGLSTTSSVNVTVNQTFSSVSVAPTTVSLSAGQTAQFIATARDQFGNALAAQPTFTWTVSGGGSISAGGLFTAPTTSGTSTIRAASGSLSATASAITTNTAPTVANSASASPNAVSGVTTNLSVLGADDAGAANLTYSWATTGSPTAPVNFSINNSNDARNTVAIFSQAGVYSFTVTITDAGGLSTTSSVAVVVSQTPATINVLPKDASLQLNAPLAFTASVGDQFGQPMAASVSWTTNIGFIDASGLLNSGDSPGSGLVTAAIGSITDQASVTVFNAAPEITHAPAATANPVTSTSTSLQVVAADDGGESYLVYSWSVSGKPAGATDPIFSTNHTHAAALTNVTFYAPGVYEFSVLVADPMGKTATALVNVTVNRAAHSLAIVPGSVNLLPGTSRLFSATAIDQFGKVMPVVSDAQWSVISGDGTITTGGMFTAPATGASVIQATTGLLSATASATVTTAPVSAPVQPRNLWASLQPNGTVCLTWQDNGTTEEGFLVQVSGDRSSWSNLAQLPATPGWVAVGKYTTPPLPPGTWYFRILAFNAAGLSAASNTRMTSI